MAEKMAKPARSEILVSFVLVSNGEARTDLDAVKRVSAYAGARFDFYELILLAAAPGRDWLETVRAEAVDIDNIRVIVLEEKQHYDDAVYSALQLSIGDVVICDETAASTAKVFDDLLESCLVDGNELVKTVASGTRRFSPERIVLRLVRFGLYAFVGRRIETDILRAFCVNRAAATRISESNDALRYFRLLNLSDQFREDRVAVEGTSRGSRLDGILRKSQISAFLVSAAASRILSGIAVLSLLLCLLSFAYTIYAVLIWLFLDSVSQGWTSLSLVLSVLFAANFGVLAAICLGVLEMLRSSRAQKPPALMQEINNADLFAQAKNLNIEIAENG